ncbi:MAG: PAS domain S-box protein [bacterium]
MTAAPQPTQPDAATDGIAGAAPSTSILRRLLVGLTVTVGLSSALVVALIAVFSLRVADESLQRHVEAAVGEAAQLLESPLWDIDMDRATRLGEAFAQDQRIARMTIHETTSGVTRTIQRMATTDTAWRVRKVMHNGREVGEVGVAFSRAVYRAQAWHQVNIAIGVSLVALLATLIGVRLLLNRHLGRPLAKLSDTVAAYAVGRYAPARVSITEFQPLLAVLNSMGERITGHILDLQTANDRLEMEIVVRRRAEQELQTRNEELAAFNRFLAVAADDEAPETVLEHACSELALILGLPGGIAVLFDEMDSSLKVVAQIGTHERALAVGTVIDMGRLTDLRRFLNAGEPLVARDVRGDARFKNVAELFSPTGVTSLIALPLVVLGVTVGGIVLTSPQERFFTDAELALAVGVAAQTGGALSRYRARTAERMLRSAIEQIPESVVMTDPAGRIEYVNAAFGGITGYAPADVFGRGAQMLQSTDHGAEFYEAVEQTLRTGKAWQGRVSSRRTSGEPFFVDVVITPVRNARGDVSHYVGIGHDVTHELEREEQLRHTQRLEAVGQLAGGIAHDFNNIMGAMLMELELLEMEQSAPAEMVEGIGSVRASIDRAARLTRQLLLFSRRQAMKIQPHDLNIIIAELLRMLTRLIGENIAIDFVSSAPLFVDVDAGMIEQVLTNLSVNARDAMPMGGRLTIALDRVEFDAAAAEAQANARVGSFARLRVEDTGSGMTADVQRHMFEPFFTTKEVGKGSGLGLATTYGIIAQHDGWIDVTSVVGRGTTIQIYLPMLEGVGAAASVGERSVPSRRRGNEMILVVEDEEVLRSMVARALRQLGYQVFEATSGVEALAMWEDLGARVDLVLTDMVMPGGISGLELTSRLRALKSNVDVIVMSGYSVDLVHEGDMAVREVHFLGKPFTIAALSEIVRSALDQPKAAPIVNAPT